MIRSLLPLYKPATFIAFDFSGLEVLKPPIDKLVDCAFVCPDPNGSFRELLIPIKSSLGIRNSI